MQQLHYLFAFSDFAEDCVLAVEPRTGYEGDKELGAVGVGAGVGHGEQVGLVVAEQEVLVVELVAIDGLASSSIVIGEVSALGHEAGDDAMEVGPFVAEALFVGAEGSEVGCCFGDFLVEELKDQFAGLVAAEVKFEEDAF